MKQEIIIEETKYTPVVYFDREKRLLVMRGRSIPENPEKVYDKVQDWIDNYFTGNESLDIELWFEYLNSGSSKYLFKIIGHLSELGKKNKTVNIAWFYEEDDDSMRELGEYIDLTFDIPVTLTAF